MRGHSHQIPRCRGATAVAGTIIMIVAGCADPELPAGAVARIGERSVTFSEFEEYVRQTTGESGDGFEAAVLAGLFRQFLDEESLRQLAIDEGLIGRSGGRVDAARALLKVEAPAIDEATLEHYRVAHQAELSFPERLRARHMLFETRAAAEEARRRLLDGEPFDLVADSAVGAELIEVAFEDLPDGYAGPLFGLAPGEVSQVLGDGYQHHVFQIVERLQAGQLSDEELRLKLRRELEEQALDRRRRELLQQAEDRYNVVIARSRLPFPLPSPEQIPPPQR